MWASYVSKCAFCFVATQVFVLVLELAPVPKEINQTHKWDTYDICMAIPHFLGPAPGGGISDRLMAFGIGGTTSLFHCTLRILPQHALLNSNFLGIYRNGNYFKNFWTKLFWVRGNFFTVNVFLHIAPTFISNLTPPPAFCKAISNE